VNEDGDDIQVRRFEISMIRITDLWQDQLFFSLPNGEPATFLFHNFENVGLAKRIFVSSWLALSQKNASFRCFMTGIRWSYHR
jgi:hypothetical protein